MLFTFRSVSVSKELWTLFAALCLSSCKFDILLFYLILISVSKPMCSSNGRSRNYWWTLLSMSWSPSMRCWLQKRRPSSWRNTMWWIHRYVPLQFVGSYCFVVQALEVMVPRQFCSLLLLHLVECNNAAWCGCRLLLFIIPAELLQHHNFNTWSCLQHDHGHKGTAILQFLDVMIETNELWNYNAECLGLVT